MQKKNSLRLVITDTPDAVRLTGEDAMALLDMALLCPCDLSLDQQKAVQKLSDYCRDFLRHSAEAPPPLRLEKAA